MILKYNISYVCIIRVHKITEANRTPIKYLAPGMKHAGIYGAYPQHSAHNYDENTAVGHVNMLTPPHTAVMRKMNPLYRQ